MIQHKAAAIVCLIHAAALTAYQPTEEGTNPEPDFPAAARVFWNGASAVIEGAEGLSAVQRVACIAAVSGIARKHSAMPEHVKHGVRKLAALVSSGSWADAGIVSSALDDPSPELRAALGQLLAEFIETQYAAVVSAIAGGA